ncbi:hypothetical protein GMMP1_330014 [Candidatus Magnetomoraceae bacterium gMMP-1]
MVLITYPLKQGLKHVVYEYEDGRYQVLITYPLKQGLKQKVVKLNLPRWARF